MYFLDWLIVVLYIAGAVTIGIVFSRKASKSIDHYFVAGRSLPWFIAGTSIAASTFSSDTPLIVAGISRQSGISGHWFWLSAAMGQIATVFFFAKLWRRTEATTDLEFIVQRYEPSKTVNVLRIFKVLLDGVLLNCIVMASITLAMKKILAAILDLPAEGLYIPIIGQTAWTDIFLIILGFLSIFYSALSGLYGVVYTDLLQFSFAMIASFALAIIVYTGSLNDGHFAAMLKIDSGGTNSLLAFFPTSNSTFLATFTFFVYIGMNWWYRVPGRGYYVQRLLASRSENDSVLAFLWFNICQFVIRPWPWIMVGLLSVYYFPGLKDHESSFPTMMRTFLPTGFNGLMVASLFAAFMSSMDTRLNWGASYIINDLYKPYINAQKSTRFYIIVSRCLALCFMLIALLLAKRITSILSIYEYTSVIFSGIATVMIARWYWWRVNAYSEISAIVASTIITNILCWVLPGSALFALRLLITVVLVTAIWITVTFLTCKRKPTQHLVDFYKKMQIPGPGWNKVRTLAKVDPCGNEFLQAFLGWISCSVFVYSAMIGIGKILFHQWVWGIICLIAACISGYFVKTVLKKILGQGLILNQKQENHISQEEIAAVSSQALK